MFESGLYNASVNRAYYAAFQSAIGAIFHFKISLEKISHEIVQSIFNRELIKRRKIFQGKYKSFLLDMQYVRDDADYKPILISQKVASRHLKKSIEFIEQIKREIKK